MSIMQVEFERSGGFANAVLAARVNTDSRTVVFGAAHAERALSDGEARQIEERIRAANLSAAARHSAQTSSPADQFQYRLVVESPAGQQEIVVPESEVQPNLQPLIDLLLRLARGQTAA